MQITGYNSLITDALLGTINLTSDVIKVALLNGYTFNAGHTSFSDLSSKQIAGGNGYTTGGQALQGVTLSYDSINSRTKLDADDVTWSAVGGSIGPCTGAVIYSDTSVGDKLIAYIDFEGTETANEDTDFRLTFSAFGILTISAI